MAKGNQHLYLTTIDITAIAIVRPHHIHRSRAYKHEVTSILCTCQYIPFQYLTFNWKVNYVDDFDENEQENVTCQHAYVEIISIARSSRLFGVHNRTTRRSNCRVGL